MQPFTPPPPDCPLCPRLVAFRTQNQQLYPHFFNGAVPPFGSLDARILVVGLAPGLKGANATGRPFTGDFAGIILYEGLVKAGLASGDYQARADDGFTLHDVRISNAVRCVPPQNKPTPEEAKTCNPFLVQEMAAMPNLKLILSLGATSHQAVLRTLKLKQAAYKFAHGAVHDLGFHSPLAGESKRVTRDSVGGSINKGEFSPHQLGVASLAPPQGGSRKLILLDSYHTSRYNIQTGTLTRDMFDTVLAHALDIIN